MYWLVVHQTNSNFRVEITSKFRLQNLRSASPKADAESNLPDRS